MENSFGAFLKVKRQEKNLTQKELSTLLFVSESAVSKWEKDVAHPDITLLPKLAEILGVSEHELITASVDKKSREEKVQAKKWRVLSLSWSLFFYISYALALIPCFICNLAINGTLSWFWIVLSALVLAFTFTNLPGLIKKHKLILLPLSMFLALCLLLGVCAIYTGGNWFWIPVLSVLFALIIVFVPIYISKYKVFSRFRSFNDFVSVAVDFLFLNFLLIVIDLYTYINGYSANHWYLSVALPIVLVCYLILSLFMCVRFLKVNKLLKTSLIMFMIDIIYCVAPFVLRSTNSKFKYEVESINVFGANLADWSNEVLLERNIHLIVFLTVLGLGVAFLVAGGIKQIVKHKGNKV